MPITTISTPARSKVTGPNMAGVIQEAFPGGNE